MDNGPGGYIAAGIGLLVLVDKIGTSGWFLRKVGRAEEPATEGGEDMADRRQPALPQTASRK
jgi:hypothetical protein